VLKMVQQRLSGPCIVISHLKANLLNSIIDSTT